MRIALETLGCKLNQAETEILVREFTRAGHNIVTRSEPADICIINTCTVTHVSDSKSRHLLRQTRRHNPNALIIATGCYAQRAPDELARLKEIDMVIGNDRKMNLPVLLAELGYTADTAKPVEAAPLQTSSARTRSSVKIQDGCTSFCAYCIVPKVRSNETSFPTDEIITGIKDRVAEGYKEIVLTGTKVGSYNHNGINLYHLLKKILAETDVPRIRLSSLQPQEISPALILLWDDTRLCPHFHLSLQSGSDRILQRMKRRYLSDDFGQAVSLIRENVPDAAITTDIITGFPGETGHDFEESYNFCQKMGFARIHVFPYSIRSGTEAAHLPDQVDDKVKQQRTQKMLNLAKESSVQFRQRFSGRTMTVLWEQQTADNHWTGVTGNYIRVQTKSDNNLANQLIPATIP